MDLLDLPVELILLIFTFLDTRSLAVLTEVCQKFYEIIAQSKCLNEKSSYLIYKTSKEEPGKNSDPGKVFTTITIKEIEIVDAKDALKLFKKRSKHLKNLCIYSCTLDFNTYFQILNLIPRVRSIKIEDLNVISNTILQKEFDEPDHVPNLWKSIFLDGIHSVIFRMLKNMQTYEKIEPTQEEELNNQFKHLEFLKYSHNQHSEIPQDFLNAFQNVENLIELEIDTFKANWKLWIKVLCRQNNLKILRMLVKEMLNLDPQIRKVKFQLKELNLRIPGVQWERDNEAFPLFKDFIKTQNSIETLDINWPWKPNSDEVENVEPLDYEDTMNHLLNLKSLKSLEMDCQYFSSDLEVRNHNVKSLKVQMEDARALRIFKFFPAVESLHIRFNKNVEQIITDLNCMPHLTELSLVAASKVFLESLRLQNLTKFSAFIGRDITPETWSVFTKNNPNINNLDLRAVKFMNPTCLLAIVENLPGLEYLNLRKALFPRSTKDIIFHSILNVYSNLKYMELKFNAEEEFVEDARKQLSELRPDLKFKLFHNENFDSLSDF